MSKPQYRIVYSDRARKNVTIRIAVDGVIEARAPRGVSRVYIEGLIESNLVLLERRRKEYLAFLEKKRSFTMTYGGTAPMLGVDRAIRAEGEQMWLGAPHGECGLDSSESCENDAHLEPFSCRWGRFDSDFFIPIGLSSEEAEAALVQIYTEAAKRYLPARTEEIATEIGTEYPPVRITGAKTRWGSCTHDLRGKNARICYSWRVMLASPGAIDSVIVHELCHLEDANHGERFWRHVNEVMPDYALYSDELKRLSFYIRERFHF